MSKHTEKPWEIEKTSFEEYWRPDNHYNVGPAYGITKIEDARLIAAAPDLLESLKLLVRPHGGTVATSADHELAIKARSAIAKAIGEES